MTTAAIAQYASAVPLGKTTAGGCPQQLEVQQTLCFRRCVAVDFAAQGYFFKVGTAPALHCVSPQVEFGVGTGSLPLSRAIVASGANCRSLGFARDDSKERVAVVRRVVTQRHYLGNARLRSVLLKMTARKGSQWCEELLLNDIIYGRLPPSDTPLSFLSSRAKPRDLQFAPGVKSLC